MDTDDIDVARLVRLRGSVWAAIEGIAGKRGGAGFVRAAVMLHLERCITDRGSVDIKRDDIKTPLERIQTFPKPDVLLNPAEELIAALRAKPMTAREAAVLLGWPEGKVRKAELALSKDGLIWYQGGVMTAME